MEQNKIVEALQKALAQGSGTLDDLDNLLKRARADIEQAKKDEAAAAERAKTERGDKVAKIATRLLNSQMTAEDMAFVMNVWFEQNNLQPLWTADGITKLMKDCDTKTTDYQNEVNKAIEDLADLLNKTFNLDIKPEKIDVHVNKKPKPEKDPDDVIAAFLKKFGLD